MAQTIAAQRGSTTVTANGTSTVTLFTQSTGIATRVILNSVSFYTNNGASNTRMSLCININGTGNQTCVAIVGTSNGQAGQGLTMFPGCQPQAFTNITATANTYIDRWIPASLANKNIGTDLQNGYWGYNGPNGSTQDSQGGSIEYVPSQFWMNSGDSLVFRCKSYVADTATVMYSFTTITES
jgi:hypothetical protein